MMTYLLAILIVFANITHGLSAENLPIVDQNYLYSAELVYDQNQILLKKAKEPEVIKVVTYNLGLLSPFGRLFELVPFYPERSKALKSVLTSFITRENPSIISLQELWYRRDMRTVQKIANDLGYHLATTKKRVIHHSGTQVLIKKDLVKGNVDCEFLRFRKEFGMDPRVFFEKASFTWRGIHYCDIRTKKGNRIHLADAHFTPLLGRGTNMRQMQLKMTDDMLFDRAEAGDYAIIGADFNLSPYFVNAPHEFNNEEWLDNAALFSDFIQDSGMIDTYIASEKLDELYTPLRHYGYTQNNQVNLVAHMGAITNVEPDQRIDFIFIGKKQRLDFGQKGFSVSNTKIVLTEKVVHIERKHCKKRGVKCPKSFDVELSDHYGVMSTINLH
jgi:hypothetical protein